MRRAAHRGQQGGQGFDILAVDFNQLEPHRHVCPQPCVDSGLRGLDQRRLAHAARAPEQHIVGRQAAREPLGVGDKLIADPVDSDQQIKRNAVDLDDRLQRLARGGPDKGIGGLEVGALLCRRGHALERVGNSGQNGEERMRLGHGDQHWTWGNDRRAL